MQQCSHHLVSFMRYHIETWFWPFRLSHISALKASVEAIRQWSERLARDLFNVSLNASGDARMAAVWGCRNRDFGTCSKMVCSISKQKSSFKWLKRTRPSKIVAKSCSQLSNYPRSGFSDKVWKCHFSRDNWTQSAILTSNFSEKSPFFEKSDLEVKKILA